MDGGREVMTGKSSFESAPAVHARRRGKHRSHLVRRASMTKPENATSPPSNTKTAVPGCQEPSHTYCTYSEPEYFYSSLADACVLASENPVQLCNRGRNKFSSLNRCEMHCVRAEQPHLDCLEKPQFTACKRLDVKPTWAIFNGEKCVRWPFPDGLCPARNNSAVFKSRRECANRCLSAVEEKDASTPGDPCPVGPGPAEVCRPEVLRFPYFSHHSANECFQASEEFLRNRRCLTTPTIFPDKEKCRQQCMGKTRRRR